MKRLAKALLGVFGLEVRRRGAFEQHGLPDSSYDDYNWQTYSDEYRAQLLAGARQYTSKLKPGDYALVDGVLTRQQDILPLSLNHRLLYETLLLLQPSSVLEVGCGGGDHLYNLGILAPNIRAYGVDRADAQLEFARTRSPDIAGRVQKFDMTMPLSDRLPPVDVAYTLAVLMHIQTGNGHLVALGNMFRLASRHVVLLENWTRHPFLDDITSLFGQGMIPWREIHFYQRRSPEAQNRPHMMVVSATELPFEPLTDYAQLLEGSPQLGWV